MLGMVGYQNKNALFKEYSLFFTEDRRHTHKTPLNKNLRLPKVRSITANVLWRVEVSRDR